MRLALPVELVATARLALSNRAKDEQLRKEKEQGFVPSSLECDTSGTR